MLWAVSISVVRHKRGETDIRHTAATVEAANKYEAEGKSLRIARGLYPESDGWCHHDAAVYDISGPVAEPGNVTLVRRDIFAIIEYIEGRHWCEIRIHRENDPLPIPESV